jgi:hypothetical protein
VSSSSGGTSGARTVAKEAGRLIDQEDGFQAFIQNIVLGGIVYQFGLQVIEVLESGGGLLLGPVRALGRGLIDLVDSTFGNMTQVLDAGTAATVQSFADGVAAALGPFAQPTAVGVIMLSLGIFIWGINRLEISPLSFFRAIRS